MQYSEEFGVRWLLRRFNIYPNAYYNFLKNRNKDYEENKARTLRKIVELYHQNNGVPGCQMMRDLLALKDINYCRLTILKYMRELQLYSIVRRRKPNYLKGRIHLISPDLLQQNFNVQTKNTVWCTDFTYLFLKDGTVRYNCTIIDLYDRSVVASMNGNKISAELAVETLRTAVRVQKPKRGLIIH